MLADAGTLLAGQWPRAAGPITPPIFLPGSLVDPWMTSWFRRQSISIAGDGDYISQRVMAVRMSRSLRAVASCMSCGLAAPSGLGLGINQPHAAVGPVHPNYAQGSGRPVAPPRVLHGRIGGVSRWVLGHAAAADLRPPPWHGDSVGRQHLKHRSGVGACMMAS